MTDPLQNRRTTDSMVAVIAVKLDALHGDMNDMKSTLKGLADAIIKLALVEERQGEFAKAQERAFELLDRMDRRVDVLELASPASTRVANWFDKALWAAVVIVGVFLFKKAGLM